MDNLPVFYEQRRVGTIEVFEDGPTFIYDPAWLSTRGAFPLSLLMPLSTQRTPADIFYPWAANLLPEAENLRIIGQRIGAATGDVVTMLSEIGRDTAGALSIGRPGTTSPANWRPVGSEANLERVINELPRKPFLVGDDGVSMSLAGVQNKLSVSVNPCGDICIPVNGAPSTHILKPDSDRLYGGVANEALCLVLARLCGLTAPDVTTGVAGERTYLLVTRYDRLEQNGKWRRLHQEDFCQALGKPPSAKYEASAAGVRGPTLADMFALTRNAMGAADVLKLLDHVLFNVLTCNTDAHAKNYSLMISGRGFSLAPIYDVMCASVFAGVTRNMAQKIAGKNRGEHLKRRHWERFAADCSLNGPRLYARIAELADAIEANAATAAERVREMPAGGHVILDQCVTEITGRARAIRNGLADVEDVAKPLKPRRATKARKVKAAK